jgi:hypothetical protein
LTPPPFGTLSSREPVLPPQRRSWGVIFKGA